MLWIKKYVIISLLVLTACATSEQASDFDSSLYSGKPVESLTNDEPPKTEEEAISRGDIALTNKMSIWHCMNTFAPFLSLTRCIKTKRYTPSDVFT